MRLKIFGWTNLHQISVLSHVLMILASQYGMAKTPTIPWSNLPKELEEAIFNVLEPLALNHASEVCKAWKARVGLPHVWTKYLQGLLNDAVEQRVITAAEKQFLDSIWSTNPFPPSKYVSLEACPLRRLIRFL